MQINNQKLLKGIIISICVIVPLLVSGLYLLPSNIKEMGIDTSFLPKLNATVNSLTSVLLILALVAVINKNYELHKKLMLTSLCLGAVFLLSYVAYHATTVSVKYGDLDHNKIIDDYELSLIAGSQRWYQIILASHILLSMIVLPFVLFAVYFGLTENNFKHKKIVKFAYPIWLYVSVTGVVVYFMISPYYA